VTLSIATLDILTIPTRIIEPLIAASIVWVALENLLVTEPDRRRWIWILSLASCTVRLASALGELDLKGSAIVRALVGFNVRR